MPYYTDQVGRNIFLEQTPQRIVSIVPSQTELLADLGLHDSVVGITRFCIHPGNWFRKKVRVGGTKDLKLDIIKSVHPDLVIANKEENLKEQVEALEKDCPVWISDINDLASACDMIEQVGSITNTKKKATEIIVGIKNNFSKSQATTSPPLTCYLIWKDPYMSVGGDTFIHAMLREAGFDNIFANRSRYPEILLEELLESRCEVLLLSSEPYPFREKQKEELEKKLPGIKILLVDGEMFSWYGSRLLHAPAYFSEIQKSLIH